MNYGRLVLAAVVAMVVDLIYGYVVFGMALGSYIAVAPGVFRPLDAVTQHLPALFGGTLLGMLAATAIYAKGYEGGSGLMEGVKFGVIMGLFLAAYFSSVNYGTMRIGKKMALTYLGGGFGEWLIVGTVIGLVHGSSAAAARRGAGV